MQGQSIYQKAEHFEAIIKQLSEGIPVYVAIKSTKTQNSHAVAVVGYDAATRKIAILDSRVYGDSATVSWFAFEDVFIENVNFFYRIYLGFQRWYYG